MGVFTPIQYPTALSRFYGEAPYYPRCSFNKTAVLSRPRHLAFDYPYMQVNRNDMRSWLVFDMDHAGDWLWESEDFPVPNLIVRDPRTGSSHWFYAIEPVLTGPTARPKPLRFMQSVYRAMRYRINADIDYAGGPVAKTPGHPQWETLELHGDVYSLGELADYPYFDEYQAKQPPPWRSNMREVSDDDGTQLHSRHVSLFLSLQKIAFSSVWSFRCQGSRAFPKFYNHLLSRAQGLNRFSSMGFSKGNLPHSSLKATVKSVSRWVWDNYYASSRPNLGVMNLDPSLPREEKQRLSATRTHALKIEATRKRIRAAVNTLNSLGESISFTSVAREAGLCRQTVSKHRSVIESTLTDLELQAENSANSDSHAAQEWSTFAVNFAAYQVTTVVDCFNDRELVRLVRSGGSSPWQEDADIIPKCRGGP
ncbi:replication initiation protein [Marinobacter sp.]|uniref:replication initiation protein n=1 Tax=Marinobacter sp. TaxID=50741 RepID=UPI003567E2E3